MNQPGGASGDDKKISVAGTRSMIARRFPKWGAGSRLMPRAEREKTSQKPIFIGPSPVQRPSAHVPSSSLPLDRKHRATPCPLPLGQARGGQGAPIPLGGVSSGGVWWLAYRFTSDRVLNGDYLGSEAEHGRRLFSADWPRRDGMSVLDSAHAVPVPCQTREWRRCSIYCSSKTIVAHSHLFTHETR